MPQSIRIRFCDFHRRLPQSLHYFRALLGSRYVLDERAPPDFVIYSNYGRQHRQYRCPRIFYSMENERPDFHEADYAFTFDYLDDDRHYRLPYYVMQPNVSQLAPRASCHEAELDADLASRTEFCAFVHSNPFGACRNRLFELLSRYRPVVSGGRYRNNLGYLVADKVEFMRRFKFGFAFENESHDGYTTEKLTDVFLAGAIPIYWGNRRVAEEFNPSAMLSRHDFPSDEALIERIVEIDGDERLWRQYRRQPCFVNDAIPAPYSDQRVLERFETIFSQSTQPVATTESALARHLRRHVSPAALSRRVRRFTRHSIKGLRLKTGI